MLAEAGVQSVKLPRRSPNLNAYAERFVRTIKESCLERMIFFGETSLRKAIAEFVAHYHLERNHQGLGNRLIVPIEATGETAETVQRRQRLGGMLNYYYRESTSLRIDAVESRISCGRRMRALSAHPLKPANLKPPRHAANHCQCCDRD